jgi:NADH-quinone oxidoreductase subunit A
MHSAITDSVGVVAYLALFAGIGILFVFVNLLVGRFLRPHNPHEEKLEIYECGEPAIGSSFVQFDLRFYVVALIFIIFDVEVAFLFPWATVFGKAQHLTQADKVAAVATTDAGTTATATVNGLYEELGVHGAATTGVADVQAAVAGGQQLMGLAIAEVLVFFIILLIGFAYVWRMGALDWVRATTNQEAGTATTSVGVATAANDPVLSA